jgi:hypothetical protein
LQENVSEFLAKTQRVVHVKRNKLSIQKGRAVPVSFSNIKLFSCNLVTNEKCYNMEVIYRKKSWFIILLLHVTGFVSNAQNTFQKRLFTRECYDVLQSSDSNFVFLGNGSYSPLLCKLNRDGDTLWSKKYGSYGPALSLKQTFEGGYILGGMTTFGAGDYDAYLIKTNTVGDTSWTRSYGGNSTDVGNSVQQTSDGGYIVAGYTKSFGAGMSDVYLIKVDPAGDIIWTKTYGGIYDDAGNSVQQTSDGGYIITGYTGYAGPPGASDVYLIKTNGSGDTLWTRTFSCIGKDGGNSVRQTSDGGYIIAGYTSDPTTYIPGAGGYLIKTNSLGDTLWTKSYKVENFTSLDITNDFGYIITGRNGLDVCLIKTNSTGDTLWTKAFADSVRINYANSVSQTFDGGFIIAGMNDNLGGVPPNPRGYLIKTNSTGHVGCNENNSSIEITSPLTTIVFQTMQVSAGGTESHASPIVSNFVTQVRTICSSVGINEVELQNQLNVFPNPSSCIFHLSVSENMTELKTLIVSDLFGRQIMKRNVHETQFQIDLTNFSEGVYLIKIISGENIFQKKILLIK